MPFSQDDLNTIFRTFTKSPDKPISRESSTLEYKLSFGWKSLSKYLKSFAAFANSKGGYIVFGVGNRPRLLVGLNPVSQQLFEDIDPEKITEALNYYFSPEIEWDIQVYELNQKTYGIIYVHECHEKPVMCTRNADTDLKEGDIYYRYRGRSEKIKFPELKELISANREKEQRLWMQHLVKIAKIGVRDIGIFDLQTGQVTGSSGSFLIDESLLSQLAFIKEGEFSVIKGKPTLRIIGEAEVISSRPINPKAKSIVKIKGIRFSDIVLDFLKCSKIEDPKDYITQICSESSAFLPIYYYMKMAGLNREEALNLVRGTVCRTWSRKKLIERLEKNIVQYMTIPNTNSRSSDEKRSNLEKLLLHTIDGSVQGKILEHYLQAIRYMKPSQISDHNGYLRNLLEIWFNKHYASLEGAIADNLRRTICWVDEALYNPDI